MGDTRRFNLFADVVKRNIPTHLHIADIAGGKGYLQLALNERGYNNVTTIDKTRSPIHKLHQIYKFFHYSTEEKFEAIVGMHPDQSTDHIILYAGKNRIPAIVCPCCVMPDATTYFGDHSYPSWIKHLKKIAAQNKLQVTETQLPMNGKNAVLICRP